MNGWHCEDCGWSWPLRATPPDGAECDNCGGELITDERPSHLEPCGCIKNQAGAHRVGCPDYPEGVR